MRQREPFDLDAYVERTRNGPCFICEFLKGNPDYRHHVVCEEEDAVAFLAGIRDLSGGWSTQTYGYTLVVPREHRTQVTGDFSGEEYLRLQQMLHRVSEALCQELNAERMYLLSLGSNQGNSHVHWHVVPLPRNVPYEQQQFHLLMAENGNVRVSEEEMAALAARLRQRLSN